LSKHKYFQFTQEKKILDEKCLFIAISFYRNIVRQNVSCEEGLRVDHKISMQILSVDRIGFAIATHKVEDVNFQKIYRFDF